MRIVRRGADGSLGEVEDLADEDALACLLSRDASLFARQLKPPFIVLGHLEAATADPQVFGKPFESAEDLQNVADLLFQSGVRLNFANGQHVTWFADWRSVAKAARRRWSDACFGSPLLAEEVLAVGPMKSSISPSENHSHKALWETDRGSSSWINIKSSSSAGAVRFDREWSEYKRRTQILANRIGALIADALRDGRILCSEDLQHGSRFLPPSLARRRSRGSSFSFCFSDNLPRTASAQVDDKTESLREASEWMHRVIDEMEKLGKFATARQVIPVAVAKFHIPTDGARTEWRSVRSSRGNPGGTSNFPDKFKVEDDVV